MPLPEDDEDDAFFLVLVLTLDASVLVESRSSFISLRQTRDSSIHPRATCCIRCARPFSADEWIASASLTSHGRVETNDLLCGDVLVLVLVLAIEVDKAGLFIVWKLVLAFQDDICKLCGSLASFRFEGFDFSFSEGVIELYENSLGDWRVF